MINATDELRDNIPADTALYHFSSGETLELASCEFDDENYGTVGVLRIWHDDRCDEQRLGFVPDCFDRLEALVIRDRGRRIATLIVEPTRFVDEAGKVHGIIGRPLKSRSLLDGAEIIETVADRAGERLLAEWLASGAFSMRWGQSHHSVWRLRQLEANRLDVPMAGQVGYYDLIGSLADDLPKRSVDRSTVLSGLHRIRLEAERRDELEAFSVEGRRFRDETPDRTPGMIEPAPAATQERYARVRDVVVEYADRWFSSDGEGVAADQMSLFSGV